MLIAQDCRNLFYTSLNFKTCQEASYPAEHQGYFIFLFFSRCRYCIKAKNKPTVNDNIDMTDFYDDDYDLDDDDYEDEDDEAGDDTDDSGNGKS